MTIGQSMLPEFDNEMQGTRKTLERVPDEKWGWKPHEKSGTVGWMASHIATMPDWIGVTLKTDELDYAPVNGPAYQPPKIENRQQLLAEFERCRPDERMDPAGRGKENLHDAEDRVHSRNGAEPHYSPSSTTDGVLPLAGNSRARPLRTKRGRSGTSGCGGQLNFLT
jgi:DinB superfamily